MPPKQTGVNDPSVATQSATAPGKKVPTAPVQAQAQQERTKVIIRKGPAEIPEDVFWRAVEASLDQNVSLDVQVDWRSFKQGRARKIGQTNKETIESVAYLHFKRHDALARFANRFQGHAFRDSKGQVSQVHVEYAPFQKLPILPNSTAAKKTKPDALVGTIDEDQDYLDFVTSLTAEPAPTLPTAVASTGSTSNTVNVKSTPLLEELRAKKAAQLAKRERVRSGTGTEKKSRKEREKERDEARKAKKKKKAEEAAAASNTTGKAVNANAKEAVAGNDKDEKNKKNRKDRKDRRKEKEKEIAAKARNIVAKQQQQDGAIPSSSPGGTSASRQKQLLTKTGRGKPTENGQEQPKMTILAPPSRSVTSSTGSTNAPARSPNPPPNTSTSSSTLPQPPKSTQPKLQQQQQKALNNVTSRTGGNGAAFDFDAILRSTAQEMTSRSNPPKAAPTAPSQQQPAANAGRGGRNAGPPSARGGASSGRGRGAPVAGQNTQERARIDIPDGPAQSVQLGIPTGPSNPNRGRGGGGPRGGGRGAGRGGPGRGRGGGTIANQSQGAIPSQVSQT